MKKIIFKILNIKKKRNVLKDTQNLKSNKNVLFVEAQNVKILVVGKILPNVYLVIRPKFMTIKLVFVKQIVILIKYWHLLLA